METVPIEVAREMLAALKAVKTNNDPAWETLDNLMTVVEAAIKKAEATGIHADSAGIDPFVAQSKGWSLP